MSVFDTIHIIPLGSGANRKIGRGGIGCDCKINKTKGTRYEHRVLDGQERDYCVEKRFQIIKCQYPGYTIAQIRKIAWGMVFGKYDAVMKAIEHNLMRKRGLTKCVK